MKKFKEVLSILFLLYSLVVIAHHLARFLSP